MGFDVLKLINSGRISRFQILYKVLFLLVLFPTLVPFVHHITSSYIKVFLLLGAVLVILKLLAHEYNGAFWDVTCLFLGAFLLSYLVTILVNKDRCFSENIRQWLYMSIIFLVAFHIGENTDIEAIKKEFLIVNNVVAIASFLLSIICLLTYYCGINEWYRFFDGSSAYLHVGVFNGDLWGLYNPNICATVSAVSILSSMSLLLLEEIKRNTKYFVQVLLALNIVIELVILILTNSRGALIALLSTVVFVSLFWLLNCNVGNRKSSFNKLVIIALVFLALLVIAIVIVNAIPVKNSETPTPLENIFERIISNLADESSAPILSIFVSNIHSLTFFQNLPEINFEPVLNGRAKLWNAAILIIKDNMFFGVTREGLVDCVWEKLINIGGTVTDYSSLQDGGLHNIYLTILASSGIVGFIVIAIAIINVFKTFINVAKSGKEISKYILLSLSFVMFFLLLELVENRTLYQVNVFNVLFWIELGYLYYFSKQEHILLK